MKIQFLVALQLLFILPLAAQTKKDSLAAKGVRWASLEASACRIGYPADWTADQSGMMGARFILFSPLDQGADPFQENVNLQITDLGVPDVITLDIFAKAAEEQIEKMIDGAVVLRSEKAGRAGNPRTEYYAVEFTGKQGKLQLHWLQHYRLKGRYAYILTFTADRTTFERYRELAEKILGTFEIL